MPRTRRLSLIAAPALIMALGGCAAGGGGQHLQLSSLPLVRGSHVVLQTSDCDPGANAYCAIDAVIVNHSYASSGDMVTSERSLLRSLGWSLVNADTGLQSAAESPGHRLRVTYATALGDLQGIDFVWIHRPHAIELALSRALFAGSPTMSIMLEAGPS